MKLSFYLPICAVLYLGGGSASHGVDMNAPASEPVPGIKLPFDMVEVPSRFVLTGNPSPGELALGIDPTYQAVPPYDNPGDPQNQRLIDGDPILDWTTTTGINYKDQTVTFDLQQTDTLDEVALFFDQPQKPASVTVAVAFDSNGPWREVGTVRLEDEKNPWWHLSLEGTEGRFVRLEFKLKEWGWYLREVKIYGGHAITVDSALRRDGRLVLADKTRPCAEIVVADRTYTNVLRAATLFQKLTHRMTGALLPIVPESKFDPRTAAILIGDSKLARQYGVSVEQNPLGDDRYVLRTGPTWLALVGNDACPNHDSARGSRPFCGSIYAVYDFFERCGCGWYGPDPLWQIIPPAESLTTPDLAISEVPAFSMRDLWLGGLTDLEVRDPWRLGGLYIQIGHAYDELVPPAKYKASHPDWFGPDQPDMTNPEVVDAAVENLGAQLDARPDDPLVTFSASCNDNGGFRDPPCQPKVGNISAQELYFANEIAKGLRRTHPQRHFQLGMCAYWFSHGGPVPTIKGEPEVQIFLVDQGNHAKPLEESNPAVPKAERYNAGELSAIATWKQTGRLTGVYEWWIPVLGNKAWKETPWYDADTTLRNLRFWHREGIRNVTYEIQGENGFGFPLRWAQYYLAARGLWNPDLDPHQVLLEACGKLFGPAAAAMTSFYELQQSAMRATTEHGGNWNLPAPQLLYTTQIETQGDTFLAQADQALALAPPNADERARVESEHKEWTQMEELNAAARKK